MQLSHAELHTILKMLPADSRFILAVKYKGGAFTHGNVDRAAFPKILRALADEMENPTADVREVMRPTGSN